MLHQYPILDQTVDTGLHPPTQRVLSWSINVVKVSVENGHFFPIHYLYGDFLCSTGPSTAFDSLSHCQNRNLRVFFAQKTYLNHWYSQYINALFEGGTYSWYMHICMVKASDTLSLNTGSPVGFSAIPPADNRISVKFWFG